VICGGVSDEGAREVEEDVDLEEAVVVVAVVVVLFVRLIVALFVILLNGENDVLIGSALIPSSSR